MKSFFPLFILSLFLESLFIDLRAQGIISGHVKNTSGESLVGCSVMLLQSDSIIGGMITDSKGILVFKDYMPEVIRAAFQC